MVEYFEKNCILRTNNKNMADHFLTKAEYGVPLLDKNKIWKTPLRQKLNLPNPFLTKSEYGGALSDIS